jgi:hypothetical protein
MIDYWQRFDHLLGVLLPGAMLGRGARWPAANIEPLLGRSPSDSVVDVDVRVRRRRRWHS